MIIELAERSELMASVSRDVSGSCVIRFRALGGSCGWRAGGSAAGLLMDAQSVWLCEHINSCSSVTDVMLSVQDDREAGGDSSTG